MKTFQYYSSKCILGFLLLGLMNSCSDFLEEDPQNQVATSNYYTTSQDALSAVNSIYAYLGSYNAGSTAGVYHSTFWVSMGLASDELLNNQLGTPQFDQLANFSHNAENAALLEIWQMHYKTIYLANIAIERIPLIDMDQSLRERYVNEAKFLRGLLYFNMVRMFGEIPLLISEDTPLNPEVASIEQIYDQIVMDLSDAKNLPDDGEIQEGRATSGAATSLLAKVYLRMQQYDLASQQALEVINQHPYELWEDFSNNFSITSRGQNEAIFSVGFGDGGGAISFWEVGQFNVRLLPSLLSAEAGITNAQGWQYATEDLYAAFDSMDERREASFLTQYPANDGSILSFDRIWIDKYWDREAEPNAGDSSQDFPVIRFSDVLLIYAEAQAQLGNLGVANDYLNLVRQRAGLQEASAGNMDDFIDTLLEERRREFVAEGQRWFDLTRLSRLEEAVMEAKGVSVDSHHYLFPIPQRERDINPNLPQNVGY